MNANEKWNKIVSSMQKRRFDKEDKIQELWKDIFADANFFGYSSFSGEIDSQRQMQIGSRERTIPDIIIRDSVNSKDMFVVELKQHNLPFQAKYKEQLSSYMRLLRVCVGVLICENLYIYYLNSDDTELVIEIPFAYDQIAGIQFIELFKKGNFDKQKVYDFIVNYHLFDEHVKEIEQDVLLLDIKKLVENHYQLNYTQEEINKALSKFSFKCIHKNESDPTEIYGQKNKNEMKRTFVDGISMLPSYPNDIPTGYERDKNETIQTYVRRLLPLLKKSGVLSEFVLNQLQDKNYCMQTFDLQYSLLEQDSNKIMYSGHCRYWTKYRFENYFVCSQWWLGKDYDYTCKIYVWLQQLFADQVNL